ncbi:MAG: hypothetical protein LBR95_01860 [Azoarcus sp.]|jgi:hypothetical protein|nr:hypothetical protein [Azoarcus sp.]
MTQYAAEKGTTPSTTWRANETYFFALGDGADTLLDGEGEDMLIFESLAYTDL